MSPQERTILIKTVGGPDIGMGHVYRSLALSRELAREFRVIFHVNDNPQVKTLAQEQGARYFMNEDVASLLTQERVDLLLLDQLGHDKELPQGLKSRFPHLKFVALDYLGYENEPVDVIINLFNHNLQKNRPEEDSIQYYEGLEYAVIREEYQNYISRRREIAAKVGRVLVTFGSTDPRGNARKVLRLLEEIGIRDVEVKFVFGPLWEDELPTASTFDTRIQQSVSAPVMAELMAETDLAFCGAGTTMLELLSLGTPAVILPQNSMEERFALHVERRGAIKVIRDEVNQDDISYVFQLITSPQERKRLNRRGRALIDGKGKTRICEIIAGCLNGR